MALASEFYRKLNVNILAMPLAAPGGLTLAKLPSNVFAPPTRNHGGFAGEARHPPTRRGKPDTRRLADWGSRGKPDTRRLAEGKPDTRRLADWSRESQTPADSPTGAGKPDTRRLPPTRRLGKP